MSVLLLLVSSLILAVASGADIFIDWLIPAPGQGTLPPAYVTVGDRIIFRWDAFRPHDVILTPIGNCDPNPRALRIGDVSPAIYIPQNKDVGQLTFVCGLPGHCVSGQIIQVFVRPAPNSSAISAPGPAPQSSAQSVSRPGAEQAQAVSAAAAAQAQAQAQAAAVASAQQYQVAQQQAAQQLAAQQQALAQAAAANASAAAQDAYEKQQIAALQGNYPVGAVIIDWDLRPPGNQPFLPPAYANVGDTIVFQWQRRPHNVVYNPARSCDLSQAYLLGDRSPVVYTFQESDVGEMIFTCGFRGQCQAGQIMAVLVSQAAPSSQLRPSLQAPPTIPKAPTPRPLPAPTLAGGNAAKGEKDDKGGKEQGAGKQVGAGMKGETELNKNVPGGLWNQQSGPVCSQSCSNEFLSGCISFQCSKGMASGIAWATCRKEILSSEGPLTTLGSCEVGCGDTEEMAISRTCGCRDCSQNDWQQQGNVCSQACSDEFIQGCINYQCNDGTRMTSGLAWATCRREVLSGIGPLTRLGSCTVGCDDTEAMALSRTCGCGECELKGQPPQAGQQSGPGKQQAGEKGGNKTTPAAEKGKEGGNDAGGNKDNKDMAGTDAGANAQAAAAAAAAEQAIQAAQIAQQAAQLAQQAAQQIQAAQQGQAGPAPGGGGGGGGGGQVAPPANAGKGEKQNEKGEKQNQNRSVCSQVCSEEFLSGCLAYQCSQGMTSGLAWATCREEIDTGLGPLTTKVGCAIGCTDTAAMASSRTDGCRAAQQGGGSPPSGTNGKEITDEDVQGILGVLGFFMEKTNNEKGEKQQVGPGMKGEVATNKNVPGDQFTQYFLDEEETGASF